MITLTDEASPLYEKVKGYILRHISNGAWPPNHRLPSENELVASMGVSRMTVHRALRELTAAGYLKRLQGVGTFVRLPESRSGLLEINNIAAEIAARGNRHASALVALEKIKTPAELAEQFEFGKRRKVFHSIVVHFENEAAVQLEERFVNPDLAPGYDRQDFSAGATADFLLRATPVTELEHVISAIPADADTARLLRILIGAPCLRLHRRTWSGGKVATVSYLTYVGSRYSLATRYRPSPSARISPAAAISSY